MNYKSGKIPLCAFTGCEYKCCRFDQGNYIVLYPGELEKAAKTGFSIKHLTIIDDNYFGGKKAICNAKNPASCDEGFKPLDCISYPLFPVLPFNGKITGFIIGKKCPLREKDVESHKENVRRAWEEVLSRNPAAENWLKKVELVGYTSLPQRTITDKRIHTVPILEAV